MVLIEKALMFSVITRDQGVEKLLNLALIPMFGGKKGAAYQLTFLHSLFLYFFSSPHTPHILANDKSVVFTNPLPTVDFKDK